jgi:hypothetical protein
MRVRIPALLLLLATAALGTACATSDQWTEWRQHASHFASGDHLFFSMKHQGDNPSPRVRQKDLEQARAETWWGEPVVVRPDQLFSG